MSQASVSGSGIPKVESLAQDNEILVEAGGQVRRASLSRVADALDPEIQLNKQTITAARDEVQEAEARVRDYADRSEIAMDRAETAATSTSSSFTTEDRTITVGSGGDFATIGEALEDVLGNIKPYSSGGILTTINLLSGFTVEEQIFVRGRRFSDVRIVSEDWPVDDAAVAQWWVPGDDVVTGNVRVVKSTGRMYRATSDITPSSVDPSTDTANWDLIGTPVPVSRAALTERPDWPDWRGGTYPAFAAYGSGSSLPVFGCPFLFDSSGDGTGRVGLWVGKGAFGKTDRKSGFLGPLWRNVYIDHGVFYFRDLNTSGGGLSLGVSRPAGVRFSNGSIGNSRGLAAVGCGIGAYINSTNVAFTDCDVSGAVSVSGDPKTGVGIYVQNGAEICGGGTLNASGAARVGVECDRASISVDIIDASDSADDGIQCYAHGKIEASENLIADDCAGRPINVYGGGVVQAGTAASAMRAGDRTVSASAGSRVNLNGFVGSGGAVTPAVQAFNGAKINLPNAAVESVSVSGGSEVNISGATDGAGGDVVTYQPLNVRTNDGIVHGDASGAAIIGDESVNLGDTCPSVVIYNTNLTTNRSFALPDVDKVPDLWIHRLASAGSNNSSFARMVNLTSGGSTVEQLPIGYSAHITRTESSGREIVLVPNNLLTRTSASADKGDASYTIPQGDPEVIVWDTALTADRNVNLPAPTDGRKFTIVRTSSSTGAFNLSVRYNSVTLTTLSAGQSVTAVPNHDQTDWVVFE